MSNKKSSSKPSIAGIVDMVHLNTSARLPLVGHDAWNRRRDFLKKLVGAGVVVSVPQIAMFGCKSPFSQDSCSSNSTAVTLPAVSAIELYKGNDLGTGDLCIIYIYFNKAMNRPSVEAAFSLTPNVTHEFVWSGTGIEQLYVRSTDASLYHFFVLPYSTAYTIGIAGTAKDTEGKYLDGNIDGAAGDNFAYTFTTRAGSTSCTCQSNSSCSCQSYISCPYECCDKGCPTYGVY